MMRYISITVGFVKHHFMLLFLLPFSVVEKSFVVLCVTHNSSQDKRK